MAISGDRLKMRQAVGNPESRLVLARELFCQACALASPSIAQAERVAWAPAAMGKFHREFDKVFGRGRGRDMRETSCLLNTYCMPGTGLHILPSSVFAFNHYKNTMRWALFGLLFSPEYR